MTAAEQSLAAAGFLSPVMSSIQAALRKRHGDWFDLADSLNQLGQRHVQRGCDAAISAASLDPINIGARLLMRTMTNFQGAVILAERGMSVEALTLVRNCYENGFWIAAFVRRPDSALKAFRHSEMKSQDSRADAFKRIIDAHGEDSMRADFDARMAERRPRSQGAAVGIEGVARDGGLHVNYAFYRQISADAAHPSLQSLDRYLAKVDGGWEGFVLGPDTEGVEHTMLLSIHSLISALAAFGELVQPGKEDDQALFDLNRRFKALSGV